MENRKCFLSGLDIPSGEYSIDHYVPKFWLPVELYSLEQNKVPAIKIINHIKDIKMPCEWEAQKYDLCYNALQKWNLKHKNKDIIIRALDRFATEKETLNPCQQCILSDKAKEYCYERRDLEEYRIRWLYGIRQR